MTSDHDLSSTRGLGPADARPAQDRSEIGPALTAARESAGLTQDDVAAALNLSRQLIGYWEQGRRIPRHEYLLELATLFRTDVSALLRRPTDAELPTTETAAMIYRRSTVDLDDTAQQGIAGFVKFLDFYSRLAGTLKRDVTGLTRSPFLPGLGYGEYAVDARRKASEVRQYLGLGLGPIAGLDGLIAGLGVTIYRAHLGDDLNRTISGAFYKHPKLGFSILVNLDMTRGRRRFTAVHELAHALLHSATDAIVISDIGRAGDTRETYADAFAGEFLMPEEGIRRSLEVLGAGPKLEDVEPVIHLQRLFNVSYMTALVRLRQANIITASNLDKLRIHPPQATAARLGYRLHHDESPMPRERSVMSRYPLRFRTLLRYAYDNESIGKSVIQQTLGLNRKETDELLSIGSAVTGLEPDANQEWYEHTALGAFT